MDAWQLPGCDKRKALGAVLGAGSAELTCAAAEPAALSASELPEQLPALLSAGSPPQVITVP